MKIEKESVAKNLFWILLGVNVVLVLFEVLWLETSVEGAVESERKKITDHREKLKKNAEARLAGMNELNLCKEKNKTLTERKVTLWQEQWDSQQVLFTWPDKGKVAEAYANLRFGDAVEPTIRVTYAQMDSYFKQYEDMAKTFEAAVPIKDPKTRKPMLDKNGKPMEQIVAPVRFLEGWKAVLRPVEKWKLQEGPPTDEEVWLAQEDVWVRRELLNALKEANLSVARFKADENPPAGKNGQFERTFTNPYWQIKLSLYPKQQQYYIKGSIKNIGKKRLALGRAYFWLQVQAGEKEPRIVLPIEGEARAAGESWDIKETAIDLFQDPAGLFGLEQILEPQTAPVRRIDELALYFHSHRTYEPVLLPPRQFSGAAPANAPKSSPPSAAKKGVDTTKTSNGLTTLRYTDVTDQVRRMPLAVVVIVDQAHIPEVQTALINSRLRLQITQVNWQHFWGKIKEEPEPKTKDGPKPFGIRPLSGPNAKPNEIQNTLVELSIYGIASLYERPTKKDDGDAAKKNDTKKKP